MSSIIAQLPDESNPRAVQASSISTAGLTSAMAQTSVQDNNYQGFYAPPPAPTNPSPAPQAQQQQQYHQSPPAYPVAPTPAMQPLAHAVAMYVYNGTDAGDLNLMVNDRIAVTEYMNAEWWKGRSERTGQEGIFPRSYVRVEEKMAAPQPQQMHNSYGNESLAVAQGPSGGAANGKYADMGKRAGKKVGNAALVKTHLGILLHLGAANMLTVWCGSDNRFQYCELNLLGTHKAPRSSQGHAIGRSFYFFFALLYE